MRRYFELIVSSFQYELLRVGVEETACIDRAQQIWLWCENELHEPIFVTFSATGALSMGVRASFPSDTMVLKAMEGRKDNNLSGQPNIWAHQHIVQPIQIESDRQMPNVGIEHRPRQKIPARFDERLLGAWQMLFDPSMMPLAWGGARAQQVALSHEFNMDFGAVLYSWDGWLIFIDSAGPVCLTSSFFSATVDTCYRAGGFERFLLEVDGTLVFEDTVQEIFYDGVPELPRPLTRATVDDSW